MAQRDQLGTVLLHNKDRTVKIALLVGRQFLFPAGEACGSGYRTRIPSLIRRLSSLHNDDENPSPHNWSLVITGLVHRHSVMLAVGSCIDGGRSPLPPHGARAFRKFGGKPYNLLEY